MAKEETKAEEKSRMISRWDYYQKPNGEIDCLVNRKTLVFLYGLQAGFILSYMRQIHKCSLIPIKEN